ncbi:MAG: hypothetical protein ABIS00_15455 [Gemmatimonadales bacterium]
MSQGLKNAVAAIAVQFVVYGGLYLMNRSGVTLDWLDPLMPWVAIGGGVVVGYTGLRFCTPRWRTFNLVVGAGLVALGISMRLDSTWLLQGALATAAVSVVLAVVALRGDQLERGG